MRKVIVGVCAVLAIASTASATDLAAMVPSSIAILANDAARTLPPPKPRAEYRSTVGTGELADLASLPPFAIASTEKRNEIEHRIKTILERPETKDALTDLLCLGWAIGSYYDPFVGAVFGVACAAMPTFWNWANQMAQMAVDFSTYQFNVQQSMYYLSMSFGGYSQIPMLAMLQYFIY